jgi:hypothetical protein
MLDPRLDYADVQRKLLLPQSWILPLEEPLRAEGWNVPVEKWEEVVAMQLPAEIFGTINSTIQNSN